MCAARMRLLALFACALLAAPAGAFAAGGPSGGVGVGPAPPAPIPASANPFGGRGMWIWYLSATEGGNLARIIATARAHGVTTLMVKAGDGANAWGQFSASLVSALHARRLRVCAWQYIYGNQPAAEAAVGAAAVAAGADCLLIDAESDYEGKYLAAQTYLADLRQAIGASFPVALAGFPYVDYHPAFPYSVFLGPGGAQYNVPQMYWHDIGASVDAVYAHTFAYNLLYGRPIIPLGQTYDRPNGNEIVRFRQLSRAYGTPGVSWWDWQQSGATQWRALALPTRWLARLSSVWQPPVLQSGARGDLVVWAQEHLITAGFPVALSGQFDAATGSAVQSFQLTHGLAADGVIGPQTWQVLLRYAPAAVVWTAAGPGAQNAPANSPPASSPPASSPPASSPPASSPPASSPPALAPGVAGLAHDRALRQPVPLSARLHAGRDEIPPGLGAG